jgi:hypothetical protein
VCLCVCVHERSNCIYMREFTLAPGSETFSCSAAIARFPQSRSAYLTNAHPLFAPPLALSM